MLSECFLIAAIVNKASLLPVLNCTCAAVHMEYPDLLTHLIPVKFQYNLILALLLYFLGLCCCIYTYGCQMKLAVLFSVKH